MMEDAFAESENIENNADEFLGVSYVTDDKVTECVLAASSAVLEDGENSVAGDNNVDFR